MRHADATKETEARPLGTPGLRALRAMQTAADRARGGQEGVTTTVAAAPPPRTPAPIQVPPAAPRQMPLAAADQRERRLMIAVALTALLVVIGAVSLAALESTSSPLPASAPPATSAATPAPHRAAPAPTTAHRHSHAPTRTATTAAPSTPGAPPVIASLSPASGAAGQSVVVSGSNFMSSSGQIVAEFNGQVAPTSCPQPSSCTVTVPTLSGNPASVRVTITTASGVSNAQSFSYQ